MKGVSGLSIIQLELYYWISDGLSWFFGYVTLCCSPNVLTVWH